jgi:hypothetical protein
VVGDFWNSGIKGDGPQTNLPVCVYQPEDDEQGDDEGLLFEWEDTYSVGEVLREMGMTHLPVDVSKSFSRPRNTQVQDANQEPTAPRYSDELIEMLELFEYQDMDRIFIRDLGDDNIDAQFTSAEEMRDNLLPKAQARIAAYLDRTGKPDAYFDQMDVS